jgi:hypothetical protein
MVTNLRLILSILSTPGMMKKSPGPFAPISLPSRKMTPRSYSLRILIADAAKMIKKIIKKKKELHARMRLLSFSLFFHTFQNGWLKKKRKKKTTQQKHEAR